MANSKQLKDYLHLYLGCDCQYADGLIFELCGIVNIFGELHAEGRIDTNKTSAYPLYTIKPILRPLSDMTEEEIKECAEISNCLPYGWSKHISNYKVVKTDYPNEGIEVKVTNYSFRITSKRFALYLYDYNRALCIYAPETPKVIQHLLSKHFDLFALIDAGLAIDKTTLK